MMPTLFDAELAILENSEEKLLNRKNLGTFRESLRAPVHRWFTYPAGFSYQAVEEFIRTYSIKPGQTIYDPFVGTGTTAIVAKQKGINAFGVEAHPFVQNVAETKLYWEFDFDELQNNILKLISDIKAAPENDKLEQIPVSKLFPELVLKCYSQEKLAKLWICREKINSIADFHFRNFAKLALTNLLRAVADVATGWPYVAPNKEKNNGVIKNAATTNVYEVYRKKLLEMRLDLLAIKTDNPGVATLIKGDSREEHLEIENESISLAFTSPPYLNNFDYADRTRLELYFWGECNTWGDITEKVRTKLILCATTQINRGDYDMGTILSEDLQNAAPHIADELKPKIEELSELRLIKGGKKSYDIMVGGYFNDMYQVIKETYRILKPNASFALILGDSAPYGVYIPIDTYLGEIAKGIGFKSYESETIRTRGDKWRNNPQRHSVALKECILTIKK